MNSNYDLRMSVIYFKLWIFGKIEKTSMTSYCFFVFIFILASSFSNASWPVLERVWKWDVSINRTISGTVTEPSKMIWLNIIVWFFDGYLYLDLEYWIFHGETSTIWWIHVYLADFSPFHLFGEINRRYNIAKNKMIYQNIKIKVECIYLMVVVSILPCGIQRKDHR